MLASVEQKARTGDAVVESQHVHPAPVDDVMEGGIIAGEGMGGLGMSPFVEQLAPGTDSVKVPEHAAGVGLQGEAAEIEDLP
jgi:hypothetical protein